MNESVDADDADQQWVQENIVLLQFREHAACAGATCEVMAQSTNSSMTHVQCLDRGVDLRDQLVDVVGPPQLLVRELVDDVDDRLTDVSGCLLHGRRPLVQLALCGDSRIFRKKFKSQQDRETDFTAFE